LDARTPWSSISMQFLARVWIMDWVWFWLFTGLLVTTFGTAAE
jgi:hypothetical protein